MNPYAALVAICIISLLVGYGAYERGDAIKAHAELATLKASYATAAISAVTHAQAVEAKQDAAIKTQTQSALSQASAATSKANASKAVYDAKLAAIAKQPKLDLAHQCAGVKIPSDLLP